MNNIVNEKEIRNSLANSFVGIVMKHGNASWATSELLWLVYDKYRYLYEQLDEFHRGEVDTYMVALRLLHGGN